MVKENLTMANGRLRINCIRQSQTAFKYRTRYLLNNGYSESAGTDEHRITTSENLDDLVDHPEKVIGEIQ